MIRTTHSTTRRGRVAHAPWRIPVKGWLDVLARVVRSIEDDRVLTVSRGLAFSATLALFPALIAAISLWGLFAEPETLRAELARVLAIAPKGADALLADQLQRIASTSTQSLGFGLVLGLGVALWLTTTGTAALIEGINAAYDEEETRGFFTLRWLAVRLTVVLLGFGLVAVAAFALLPLVVDPTGTGRVVDILRWPVLGAFAVVGLGAVYHYAPDRRRARMQWISPGAVIAVALWLIASYGFNLYAQKAADFNGTYGSLGGVIALMTWLFISGFMMLLGAELNAELEGQTAEDSTVGRERPMGKRGAVKADILGMTRVERKREERAQRACRRVKQRRPVCTGAAGGVQAQGY